MFLNNMADFLDKDLKLTGYEFAYLEVGCPLV